MNAFALHVIVSASAALLLSYIAVIGLRRWIEKRQILDIPNDRSSHARPVPRGGGIAIVLVTAGGVLIYGLSYYSERPRVIVSFLAGALLIAAVSWLDDIYTVPAWLRFGIHGLAALIAVLGIGYWPVPLLNFSHSDAFSAALSFLWIVGLTNAYNFMDGIDGIAGGQAVIAGFGWALLGYASHQELIATIGILLAASSLGFLAHNWPPARIFMGDVGSAFLGYSFAVLPILAATSRPRLFPAGILLLWPFLFDAIFTFLRRLSRLENVFAAHRSHIYQRWIICGASHRRVTIVYMVFAATGALVACCWFTGLLRSFAPLAFILVALSMLLWAYVVIRERRRSLELYRIDPQCEV